MTIEEELIDHEYYLRDLLRDEYAISDDTVLDLHRYYMPDAGVRTMTIENDLEETYHLILRQMNRY